MKQRRRILLAAIAMLAIAPLSWAKPADKDSKVQDRLQNSNTVLHEILNIPDNIPQDLLDKASCVIVMPSVFKAAFVVGGSYGRGAMVCRTGQDFTGPWGSPSMVALEEGSIGFQIGGEATDFVFLVINERGADSLMHSKVKLGADVSAAAGPVGRSASADTDAYLRSEILTYSRARGVFAGVSLAGASLRPDGDANHDLYGRSVTAEEIIAGEMPTPQAASALIATLDAESPRLKA